MTHIGTGGFTVDKKPYPNVLFSEDFHRSVNGDAMIRYINYDADGELVADYKKGADFATVGQVEVAIAGILDNEPAIHKTVADAVTAA